MTTTQALLDSLLAHKASINLATTEQKTRLYQQWQTSWLPRLRKS